MLKDTKAVSPVIGDIMMIAVVIVITAFVVAFAYNVLQSATKMKTVNVIVEGATVGSDRITVVHMGGGTVVDAFTVNSTYPSYFVNARTFNNLEVRINGVVYEGWGSLNRKELSKSDFEVGDELVLELGPTRQLSSGDRISVIFVPNGQTLSLTIVV